MHTNTHLNKTNNIIVFIIIFSIAFPEVTFNLVPGETSPLPFLASTGWLIYKKKKKSLTIIILCFIFTLLMSIPSILKEIPVIEILKQSVAYIQIVSVYLAISDREFIIPASIIDRIFILIIFALFVGFFQKFGIFTNAVDSVLNVLTRRGSGMAWEGRGVGFISNEPSHVSISMFFWAFIFFEKLKNNYSSLRSEVTSVLLIIYVMFFSGAGVGILLFSVFIFSYVVKSKLSTSLITFTTISFTIAIIANTSIISDRLVELANTFSDFNNFSTFAASISLLSGFRIPSVYVSYLSILDNLFPKGIASWYSDSLDLYNEHGINLYEYGHFAYQNNLDPTKPYSVASNLILDFGFISFLFLAKFIGIILFAAKKIGRFSFSLLITGSFSIMFLGTLGNPTFIAIIAILVKEAKNIPRRQIHRTNHYSEHAYRIKSFNL